VNFLRSVALHRESISADRTDSEEQYNEFVFTRTSLSFLLAALKDKPKMLQITAFKMTGKALYQRIKAQTLLQREILKIAA
jgi:hypothetical protein